MSKLSEELKLAKEKTDAFQKQEKEKRDAETSRIVNMKNSIDELCEIVDNEMRKQINELDNEIKLNGPYEKRWNGMRYGDPPNREWTIKYKNFKDGCISAWYGHNKENEITLNGGWQSRESVSCLKTDSGWSFTKISKNQDSVADVTCSLIEAVEITLSESIYSMGHDSSK